MATSLDFSVNEKSTMVVRASFTDEDGVAVVPDVLAWTLTDNEGNIINSRSGVSVTPAAVVDILLQGDDLALQSGESGNSVERRITVEGTYESTLGSGLPLKEAGSFLIINLIAVP